MIGRQNSPRVGAIDAVRGVALAGMVVFHGAWDLHWFGLVDLDPSRSAGWRLFGNGVATVFLFLSGFSLVLARRRGAGTASALRRVAVVALAALAVTVATGIVAPDQMIVFGILHCIALSNLIALPLLGASWRIVLGFALAAALAPTLVGNSLPKPLWWVGLSAAVPDTLDYRTFLPWLCPVLLGVVAARGLQDRWLVANRLDRRSARAVGWAGRHSLGLYLVHQPIMLGLLFGVTTFVGGNSPTFPDLDREGAWAFLHKCEGDCEREGAQADLCHYTCNCVLKSIGPTHDPRIVSPGEGGSLELAELTRSCLASPAISPKGQKP